MGGRFPQRIVPYLHICYQHTGNRQQGVLQLFFPDGFLRRVFRHQLLVGQLLDCLNRNKGIRFHPFGRQLLPYTLCGNPEKLCQAYDGFVLFLRLHSFRCVFHPALRSFAARLSLAVRHLSFTRQPLFVIRHFPGHQAHRRTRTPACKKPAIPIHNRSPGRLVSCDLHLVIGRQSRKNQAVLPDKRIRISFLFASPFQKNSLVGKGNFSGHTIHCRIIKNRRCLASAFLGLCYRYPDIRRFNSLINLLVTFCKGLL